MPRSSDRPGNAHTVTFQPSGRRGTASPDESLLTIARSLGVEIESVCGGKGVCGKCRVRVESPSGDRAEKPAVSPASDVEQRLLGSEGLDAGLRLACQTHAAGDVRVFVPEESRRATQVVRKEAGERTVPLDPAIKCYRIAMRPPTLEDAQADAERVLAALADQHGVTGLIFDIEALRTLPGIARRGSWDLLAIVWQGGEAGGAVIDLRPAAEPGHVLGLAVDVGTTTLAAYLVDLTTGAVVATESAMNPQVAFGDDVISRLYHAKHHEDGGLQLQSTLITEINDLANKAARRHGTTPKDILDVVMVGNTAMHHLSLGLDAQWLGTAPFTPAVQDSVDAKASALGLDFHAGCRLHVLPIEAGFVGADNVAVIIAEEPYKQDEVLLIVDIGTNGELVLGNRDRMVSASCATGPALEGAHIEFGMRAAAGAIERIRIDPQTLDVRFKVIGLDGWHTEHAAGEVKARGICGSGILEAAAEMFKAGVILPSGGFDAGLVHDRVVIEDGRPRKFVVARAEETALGRDITVSLADIRSIQLAKGALRAGAEILLRAYGIEKPDRVLLAGAFGSYIDRHHALALGMLPGVPPDRVVSVGNSAGDGARFALLNVGKRREAEWVARVIEYVELATDRDFQTEYVRAMTFAGPSMPDSDLSSV